MFNGAFPLPTNLNREQVEVPCSGRVDEHLRAAPIDADADVATTTAALSTLNLQLASTLSPDDALHGRRVALDDHSIPYFLRNYRFPVSQWPVFIADEVIRREVNPIITTLPDILYNAVVARFHDDPDGFTRYFGWPRALLDVLIRARPDSRDSMIRYDAVIDAGGVRLFEINCGSSIGGWLHDWLAPVARASLDAHGERCSWNIAYRTIFEHMLAHVFSALDRLVADATGHVLVHADSTYDAESLESFQRSLQEVYDRTRPPRYSGGRIIVCTRVDDIVFDSDAVRFDGQRIDAVLLSFVDEGEVSDAFCERLTTANLHGQVVAPDAHFQRIIGDKRMFALLHECVVLGLLAPHDAALVERHIPWTVCVTHGAVDWNGENCALPLLLRRNRATLVLKKAESFGGKDVVVGRCTNATDWAAAVDDALAQTGWIAQEYCAPARQLVCAPGNGLAAHELIWGLFAFGGDYAGAFVRADRAGDGGGVINSANGATEFIVFEDRGESRSDAPPAVAARTDVTFEVQLSPLNERLLNALRRDPEMRVEHLDLTDENTPEFLRTPKISAWPLFVGKDFARRRFATIVKEVPRILYEAITAYFGDDARAFSDYFGLPSVLYDLLRHAPVDLRELNARYDTSLTADSVRILEINCSSAAGGFQHDWIEPEVTRNLRRHAETAQWRVQRQAVFRTQLLSLIEAMLRRKPGSASGHILMYAFCGEAGHADLQASLQAVYDEVKPPGFGAARILLFTDFAAISFDRYGNVRYADVVVDAILFTFQDLVDVPEDVYRRLTEAYLARRLVFPDSPLHLLLDTKMQLALVHECCERGLLQADDREIVRDTIPWTSILCEREVEWHGERLPLSRLLVRERQRFVLKKASSFGGRDVVVGLHCDAAQWQAYLTRYLGDSAWLAQEYCPPGRVRLFDPEFGITEHDLVWGVFTFGGRYGGSFLRGKPVQGSDGVINTASGAVEILVYDEID